MLWWRWWTCICWCLGELSASELQEVRALMLKLQVWRKRNGMTCCLPLTFIADLVQCQSANGSGAVAKEIFAQYATLATENQEEIPHTLVNCTWSHCLVNWRIHVTTRSSHPSFIFWGIITRALTPCRCNRLWGLWWWVATAACNKVNERSKIEENAMTWLQRCT